MSMNIHAKKGDKVTVTEKGMINGYPAHQEEAKKYLKVGGIYTVDHTHVHQSSTDVYLFEIPDRYFNSVHFEDVVIDNPNEKIKYYVLDYGDQPVMSKSADQILEIIKAQMEDISDSEYMEYTIYVKKLTQDEIDALPEWEG